MQYLVTTSDKGDIDWKEKGPILKKEAKYIWELASKGVVRNIWFTEKTKDAILIFEAESERAVREAMDSAPLVAEGLLVYEVVGLRPYDGFERLFDGYERC